MTTTPEGPDQGAGWWPDVQGRHEPRRVENQPKKKHRVRTVLLVTLVVLGAAFLGLGAWVSHTETDYSVGRCIEAFTGSGTPKAVDCDSDKAHERIVDSLESRGTIDCLYRPGAERAIQVSKPEFRELCVGRKDLDASTSINTVRVGDCMVPDSDRPALAPCGTAGAREVVALVDHGVDEDAQGRTHVCTDLGFPETDLHYQWALERPQYPKKGFDRGVCLVRH